MASEEQTQTEEEKRYGSPLLSRIPSPPGQPFAGCIDFSKSLPMDLPDLVEDDTPQDSVIDWSHYDGIDSNNLDFPSSTVTQTPLFVDDMLDAEGLDSLTMPSASNSSSTLTDSSEIEDRKVPSFQLPKSHAFKFPWDPVGPWGLDTLSLAKPKETKEHSKNAKIVPPSAQSACRSVCGSTVALVEAQLYDLQVTTPPNADSDSKKASPANTRSRSNTFSSFAEDETDWDDDDITGNENLNFPGFSNFSALAERGSPLQDEIRDSITRPILSPMKQALVDRIMKEFWSIFDQETAVPPESDRSQDIAIDMSYDSFNDPSAGSKGYATQAPGDGYHVYRELATKHDSGHGSMPSSPIQSPGLLFQEDQAQVNNAYQPPLQTDVSNDSGTDRFFDSLKVDKEPPRGGKAFWPPDREAMDRDAVKEEAQSSMLHDQHLVLAGLSSPEPRTVYNPYAILDNSGPTVYQESMTNYQTSGPWTPIEQPVPLYPPGFTAFAPSPGPAAELYAQYGTSVPNAFKLGTLPDSHPVTAANGGEPHSSYATSGANLKASNSNQESSKISIRKRLRDDEDDPDQNEGGDGNPKRPKKFSSPPQNEDDSRKFACPYRKRDPRKYCIQHWRPCALTPLETIARVKGHLYRHHRIFPCQRCKQPFRNQDEVNSHLRESIACELSDDDYPDGVTADIIEKLRSKKTAQRTEVERWQDIYKLLFSNEMIPSPYFEPLQEDLISSPDSREIADYEAYCRRELPRDFRAALEEIVQNESQPIEESIRNQLMNIIRDCQDRIFSRYRSSIAVATTPSRATRNSQSPVTAASASLQEPADIGTSTNTTSGISAGRISPTFLQPLPPQNHLESRLEGAGVQSDSAKPLSSSDPSDSGYSSNGTGRLVGSASVNSSSDDLSCSSSQDQMTSWPTGISLDMQGTFYMNDENGDMNPGNGVMDSQYTVPYDSSWWEDGPQLADEGSRDANIGDMSMENLFGPNDMP